MKETFYTNNRKSMYLAMINNTLDIIFLIYLVQQQFGVNKTTIP